MTSAPDRHRRRCIWIPALLALLSALCVPTTADDAGRPLTDEDVVRLFVSGSSVDELQELIGTSEVAFDLSDEMVEEMRRAGLPQALLASMTERQRELDEAAEPEEAAAAVVTEPERPQLRVHLDRPGKRGDGAKPTVLRVLDEIDPATAKAWQLGPDVRQFTGMALFLACRTGDHVPDHWRSESPLGRDFRSTRRHRMLFFLPDSTVRPVNELREQFSRLGLVSGERENLPHLGVIELPLPDGFEVALEPDTAHDLTLGVALQVNGRYYVVAHDDLDGVVIDESGGDVHAEVTAGRGMRWDSPRVRFVPR